MQMEMCTKNYELENKYISPKDISHKLDQSIDNIIEKAGFIKYNIEKKSVCTNGGNYLGLLYEIDIKGKTKAGDKELNLFVKSVIPGESDLQIINVSDIYKIELFTYKELAKIFEELQEEAKVPEDERFKMVKSYDASNREVIIMENVSKKGFITGHRMDVVSLKFAEMAMKELAKFHAFSFVLKKTHPDFFENHIKTIKMPYHCGEQFHEFVDSITKIAMNNINEDVKARVEKFCEGIANKFERHYNDDKVKHCLCHGDYRPNNILMKIVDGEVSQIIPVDYQLLFYGCPIMDILYFIINSTDKAFRRAHMSNLKDLYHKTMTKFLKYFDIDVNSVYPRHKFEKEFKDKLDYGLIFALIFLPFMFASEDDIPDVTKHDMSSLSFRVDDKYKSRIQGVIEDYIEWGIL
ncbi:hypothetical protein PYW07_014089 [Mythimna separata]|uniref:CHK kinase-like domain-containing protein n=1 Tax=Mythimna separata TaxID=271217 RepID=A0AAD8DQJ5_MYTSE|nr:hypothetical protein PYW07_014089 [Mythimna separata]